MPLLELDRVEAGYGAIRALFGVSLTLEAGRTLALIGANGAGKSTLLRAIAGLTPPSAGRVRFEGADLTGMPAHAIAARGVALVPEGRRLFASLTVEENLLMGASAGRAGPWNLQSIYTLFPDLVVRRQHGATMLSGGQQQMVAIGRALMANPRLLLCDELSLGLAPVVVRGLYAARWPRGQCPGRQRSSWSSRTSVRRWQASDRLAVPARGPQSCSPVPARQADRGAIAQGLLRQLRPH
jgi:branched-chain amino acid transport system ATP-binding protein